MALVQREKIFMHGIVKNLIIGDELYLEKYDEATDKKEKTFYRKLFYKKTDKLPSIVTVTGYEDTEQDSNLMVIHILQKDLESMLRFDSEKDSILYRAPEGKKLKETELGCDTASFQINGFTIHTGCDGVYGIVFQHPTQKETIIHLFVPTDVLPYSDFSRKVLAALTTSIKEVK